MYYKKDSSYWYSSPRTEDFLMEIVSHHPDFEGKKFKSYSIDGMNTIGVFGDEAFSVHLHNKSNEDIQARLTLDGVDCLTGKPGDLEVNHDMWLIRAHSTLHLKAWHESRAGGSRLVFTGADKSVALHTTGDVSHKGIIAAAIFTEGDRVSVWDKERVFSGQMTNSARRELQRKLGGTFTQDYTKGDYTVGSAGSSLDIDYNAVGSLGDNVPVSGAAGTSKSSNESDITYDCFYPDLKKSASVGAGEYVEQKTHSVKGLSKPQLHSVMRVRYIWWDEVKAMLTKHGEDRFEDKYPSGFPAEKRTFADLSSVPKVVSSAAHQEPSRFI